MNLPQQLAATQAHLEQTVFTPQQAAAIGQVADDLRQTDLAERSLQVGDLMPNFELPTVQGDRVELEPLLAQGPVVVSFYRGSWCPFCSLELQALELTLPAIMELGATLLSISPELPRRTRHLVAEQDPSHLILHDHGNRLAHQLGITFAVPAAVRQTYQELGISLARFNGDSSHKLPVPATFVVDQNQRVLYRFLDPDHTQRLDPVELVSILRRLRQSVA